MVNQPEGAPVGNSAQNFRPSTLKDYIEGLFLKDEMYLKKGLRFNYQI